MLIFLKIKGREKYQHGLCMAPWNREGMSYTDAFDGEIKHSIKGTQENILLTAGIWAKLGIENISVEKENDLNLGRGATLANRDFLVGTWIKPVPRSLATVVSLVTRVVEDQREFSRGGDYVISETPCHHIEQARKGSYAHQGSLTSAEYFSKSAVYPTWEALYEAHMKFPYRTEHFLSYFLEAPQ